MMHKVIIYMKSGNVIRLKVGNDFKIRYDGGDVTEIAWGNSAKPHPLHIQPGQIEAVIEDKK
jgi:hypothetical protein